MRALVLEADATQRREITTAVHQAGYGPLFVKSQQEALDLLRDEEFDLVVVGSQNNKKSVDIGPLLRNLRWRWPLTNVVLLVDEECLPTTLAAGGGSADGIARRPIVRRELEQTLIDIARRNRLRCNTCQKAETLASA
jgi:DNA-binding response OmpR family regulator